MTNTTQNRIIDIQQALIAKGYLDETRVVSGGRRGTNETIASTTGELDRATLVALDDYAGDNPAQFEGTGLKTWSYTNLLGNDAYVTSEDAYRENVTENLDAVAEKLEAGNLDATAEADPVEAAPADAASLDEAPEPVKAETWSDRFEAADGVAGGGIIRQIQQGLTDRGFDLGKVDGDYGLKTANAIIAYTAKFNAGDFSSEKIDFATLTPEELFAKMDSDYGQGIKLDIAPDRAPGTQIFKKAADPAATAPAAEAQPQTAEPGSVDALTGQPLRSLEQGVRDVKLGFLGTVRIDSRPMELRH